MKQLYQNLYGQYVKLNNGHRSVCIWSKDLALLNREYIPTLITKEEYDSTIEFDKSVGYIDKPFQPYNKSDITVYKTHAALSYDCWAYLIKVDKDTYLCIGTYRTDEYTIGKTYELESFYIELSETIIEDSPMYNTFLFDFYINNRKNVELKEQIEITSKLLEATKELNGEFQEGWEEEIERGESLLDYLKNK